MFGFGKKNNTLLAAATGGIVKIEDVPDEAFSQKMLGDGYAVNPVDGTIYSPAEGTVADITDTLHAYTITTKDNLDILVHIGIDTVTLKGEGFKPLVKQGDEVTAGQPIAKVDLSLLKSKNLPLITPVVIANIDEVKSFSVDTGNVTGGETAVLTYKL